jgi:hypothetical protein
MLLEFAKNEKNRVEREGFSLNCWECQALQLYIFLYEIIKIVDLSLE